ncbi:Endoplasmic reticulum resident protein 44 [Homalodisca vitripennis]|nr:Endoplasmic reticulum resident protein 44 [Homalodisca vitripennis]
MEKTELTVYADELAMDICPLCDQGPFHSKKRIIIGFFDRKDVPEYTTFRRVATNLKDDCQFHVGFGDLVKYELVEANYNAKVVYHPDDTSHEGEEEYKGNLMNFTEMLLWGNKCCIPLVRQITFENAEELTEEGLPLMILFHRSRDVNVVKRFKISCSQIRAERSRINFLYGDGDLFSHPLSHLGKTVADLPVLAIDSFQHMYLFPDMEKLDDPDALEQFIEDLYTGKLHRVYHYGEEVVPSTTTTKDNLTSRVPKSVFVNLQPSQHRYTLLRDEL